MQARLAQSQTGLEIFQNAPKFGALSFFADAFHV
jgi:hypothetical protein